MRTNIIISESTFEHRSAEHRLKVGLGQGITVWRRSALRRRRAAATLEAGALRAAWASASVPSGPLLGSKLIGLAFLTLPHSEGGSQPSAARPTWEVPRRARGER